MFIAVDCLLQQVGDREDIDVFSVVLNMRNYRYNLVKTEVKQSCTTIHRYPIFSTRYCVICKAYPGYCGTSEIKHGLCARTVDNPLAKARVLSLRTGAQSMLYLSLTCHIF